MVQTASIARERAVSSHTLGPAMGLLLAAGTSLVMWMGFVEAVVWTAKNFF
jgi:hypothetical protein